MDRFRADQPSPLAGEGGASAPGEGESLHAEARRTPRATQRNEQAADVRRLRKDMTEAERKLWSLLRNRKLAHLKFRRQVPVGPYVADFVCLEARLIVEAEGGQHANSPRDTKRKRGSDIKGSPFHAIGIPTFSPTLAASSPQCSNAPPQSRRRRDQ